MMTEKTIPEKLQVKAGKTFRVIGQPESTRQLLAQLPQGAAFAADDEPADVVLIFVKSMEEVKTTIPLNDQVLKPDGIPWLAYPKKTSAIKTDLDRDIIWRYLNTIGWTGVAMIAIDDTWSGFRMKKVQ